MEVSEIYMSSCSFAEFDSKIFLSNNFCYIHIWLVENRSQHYPAKTLDVH